jgi:recombination protein RecA
MGKFSSIQALSAISSRPEKARVQVASTQLAHTQEREGRAPLWELWGAGQLLELSGSAPGKLSTAVRLLWRAQAEGEPCAWVSLASAALEVRAGACEELGGRTGAASFYPPDLALAGIDLAALAVVRVPAAAGPHGVVRASELLLRSGAFGLVVIDFSQGVPKGELAWQSRLSGLLRMHDARAVVLTPSSAHEPSLGPMVSLRIEPAWHVQAAEAQQAARVVLTQRVLKSKLGGAASVSPDVREAPEGALRLV